jgi:hypothetical protein
MAGASSAALMAALSSCSAMLPTLYFNYFASTYTPQRLGFHLRIIDCR